MTALGHLVYPKMSQTLVSSLGELPTHWDVRRLRTVTEMRVSNVNKDAVEGEHPVRLCNYVDVYKNDRIRADMPLMHATATASEIRRFHLLKDDVLITKDSESWGDIGIPAVVVDTADDLVCGYHLALLRPKPDLISGPFLLRALQCSGVAVQFHVRATGVTRFGLSHGDIKSVSVPVPPRDEQDLIVRYLDNLDSRVNTVIRGKQALIGLLAEQKRVAVESAVLHGFDAGLAQVELPDASWLGAVPESWTARRAKWHYREVDQRSLTGEEELLSVSHLTGITRRSEKNVTMFMAQTYAGHKLCQAGDIVINTMWAWMGALGVADQTGLVSPAYGVYRPHSIQEFDPTYIDALVRSSAYVGEYVRRSTGIRSSRLRLYPDKFLSIPLIRPPMEEQREIAEYIHRATSDIDKALVLAQREIALLQEYRTRLIADVVTGKVDVRAAAADLPDDVQVIDAPVDDLDEIDYDEITGDEDLEPEETEA